MDFWALSLEQTVTSHGVLARVMQSAHAEGVCTALLTRHNEVWRSIVGAPVVCG